MLWGQANQGQQRWWERKVRAQFYGVAGLGELYLPQQLIILYLSFQKHKSQAWIIWIMHFQSLLVLHGLQKKSKRITPWPGKQGAVHHRLLGAELCWTRALVQHCQTNPAALHRPQLPLAQSNSSTFPPREDAGKRVTLPPPWGHCTHRFPGEEKPGTTYPQHCCSLPQPPSSAMHYSSQWHFSSNLAKQECFSFNTSRTRELSGEKLVINSPLLFAVVIYSQEGWGCCHVY